MKKYIVEDQGNFGGDTFAFDTLAEANRKADFIWSYLTTRERKDRTVVVYEVTEDDLEDWAIDEDTGEIDWCAARCERQADGGFDSAWMAEAHGVGPVDLRKLLPRMDAEIVEGLRWYLDNDKNRFFGDYLCEHEEKYEERFDYLD